MGSLVIRRFEPRDQQSVLDVILPIQQEEFGIEITVEEQPDLFVIPTFYQSGSGDFYVAEMNGHIVGTLGLVDIGSGQCALRKMFVAAPFRGRAHGVAQALLKQLLDAAHDRGVREIFLGTTEHFIAAHRFYEKNGFRQIGPEMLPSDFPRVAVDTRFYRLSVSA